MPTILTAVSPIAKEIWSERVTIVKAVPFLQGKINPFGSDANKIYA